MLLCSNDALLHSCTNVGLNIVNGSTGPVNTTNPTITELDKLNVLASHQALASQANDIMGVSGDTPVCISLGMRRQTLWILRMVEHINLIVVLANNVERKQATQSIQHVAQLIKKVLITANNLQG